MIPPPLVAAAGKGAGLVHYALAGAKRRNRRANLVRVRSHNRHRPAPWRAFQNQALNTLELLRAAGRGPEEYLQRFRIAGLGNIDQALAGKRGVVLATYHSGNWELAGLALAARGYRLTTVAGIQLTARWSREVKDFKERYGIRVLGPGGSLRRIFADLEANRIVVLHLDGDIFHSGRQLDFLGMKANFPLGPTRISRTARCPLVFAYCRRLRHHGFLVTVERPLPPPGDQEQEEQCLLRLVERMEQCILEWPEQWCIFRRMGMEE